MSAYVTSDTTITHVLLAISASGDATQAVAPFDFATFGHKMRRLNIKAVRARYDDADSSGMIPRKPYKYVFQGKPSLIQQYKSLQCFLYQCSEGNVPNSKLYKALTKVSDILAHGIASGLKAYAEAAWDAE